MLRPCAHRCPRERVREQHERPRAGLRSGSGRMSAEAVLRLDGIHKAFGGLQVLRDVGFAVGGILSLG